MIDLMNAFIFDLHIMFFSKLPIHFTLYTITQNYLFVLLFAQNDSFILFYCSLKIICFDFPFTQVIIMCRSNNE